MVDKHLEMALRMVARKSYHSLELTKKMKEKGVAPGEIAPVIERLQRDGYLDDDAWEEGFVNRYCRKGKGAGALGQDLHAKGLFALLPKLKKRVEEGEEGALNAQIEKFRGDLEDPKEKRKLIQRLQRRGFNIEQIFEVL